MVGRQRSAPECHVHDATACRRSQQLDVNFRNVFLTTVKSKFAREEKGKGGSGRDGLRCTCAQLSVQLFVRKNTVVGVLRMKVVYRCQDLASVDKDTTTIGKQTGVLKNQNFQTILIFEFYSSDRNRRSICPILNI